MLLITAGDTRSCRVPGGGLFAEEVEVEVGSKLFVTGIRYRTWGCGWDRSEGRKREQTCEMVACLVDRNDCRDPALITGKEIDTQVIHEIKECAKGK
jgi:hypothetical protein